MNDAFIAFFDGIFQLVNSVLGNLCLRALGIFLEIVDRRVKGDFGHLARVANGKYFFFNQIAEVNHFILSLGIFRVLRLATEGSHMSTWGSLNNVFQRSLCMYRRAAEPASKTPL